MASLSVASFPYRAPGARTGKLVIYNVRQRYSSTRRIVAAAQGPRRDSAPSQQVVALVGTAAVVVLAASLAFNSYVIDEYRLLGAEVKELRARAKTLDATADGVIESNAKREVQINKLKEKMDILKQDGEP